MALAALARIDRPVHGFVLYRPVYTSQRMRVLDVVIPPHATTLYHTHINDVVGVTITPGPGSNEDEGSPPSNEPPDEPGNVWFEPHPTPYTHRGTNLGETPIHLVAVELLDKKHPPTRSFRDPAVGKTAFQNDRARVVRFSLAHGERVQTHVHDGAFVLVTLGPGRLTGACDHSGSRSIGGAGFVCVGAPGEHSIVNVGDTDMTLFEVELAP